MASLRPPEKALLFTGILAENARLVSLAARKLEARFGPACLGSPLYPFTNTEYYRDELGSNPVRAFLAWPEAYSTASLADAKLFTNSLEMELAKCSGSSFPRPINLDPGYLTQAKLVLASAKNFTHRIHLRDGIYAEVTLYYRKGSFRTLPWTFPDFAGPTYRAFFTALREKVADLQ